TDFLRLDFNPSLLLATPASANRMRSNVDNTTRHSSPFTTFHYTTMSASLTLLCNGYASEIT
ncbi:hypothetical protein BgiBS90_028778, partial [Biomphalaria glabrata]